MSRRHDSLLVALTVVAVSACSSGSSEVAVTTVPSTTIAAPETTTADVEPATSAVPSTSVSTTELVLGSTGLGVVAFGDDADAVVERVRGLLGEPAADSGWVDPLSTGAACPGTEVRFVTWGDLVLTFSDDTDVASGRRHFAAYTYGPAYGATIDPEGLATDGGVGVGGTVGDLLAAHPDVVIHEAGELSGPSFWIESGLHGFLSGIEPEDAVVTFVGGQACGE